MCIRDSVIADCRIYLTHIVKVPKIGDKAGISLYLDQEIDVVVFGHSHYAFYEQRDGLTFFLEQNPDMSDIDHFVLGNFGA